MINERGQQGSNQHLQLIKPHRARIRLCTCTLLASLKWRTKDKRQRSFKEVTWPRL